jgi:membrane dipeptidase
LTPFLARGTEATVDDYVDAIDYVINICGEERVGYGTDFTQGHGQGFFDWISHDKGYARRLTNLGIIRNPAGMDTIGHTGALTAAMQRRGWSETRIERIMGENWVNLLAEVWKK